MNGPHWIKGELPISLAPDVWVGIRYNSTTGAEHMAGKAAAVQEAIDSSRIKVDAYRLVGGSR